MNVIPYTNEVINKMYSETKDYIDEYNYLRQLEDEKHRQILKEKEEKHQLWLEHNKDNLDRMHEIRSNEIEKIKESDSYKHWKLGLNYTDFWISDDFYLMSRDYDRNYPQEDLAIKFGSESFRKEYKELLESLTKEQY